MMMGSALSSFFVGLFDVKYYFHLQVCTLILEETTLSDLSSWCHIFLDTTK